MVAVSDLRAIRRELDVFDPSILLACKAAFVSALDCQRVGVKQKACSVPVTSNNEISVFGPVEGRWVVGKLR